MLNVIDEFTHECLAIRVARKLNAINVIDVLSDLFILRSPITYAPIMDLSSWPSLVGAVLDEVIGPDVIAVLGTQPDA
jgi:hypothetical protein